MCYFSVISESEQKQLKPKKTDVYFGAFGLFAILICQLIASAFAPGHVQDTGLFRAWTAFAGDHHVWEYYTTELYVDYPPVYLYVLYGIGKLTGLLGISPDTGLYLACIRSIPILFDALTTVFVYRLAEKQVGQNKALVLAALCAVNPAHILNSTVWGQVDSVTTLLAAIMLLCLYKKQVCRPSIRLSMSCSHKFLQTLR